MSYLHWFDKTSIAMVYCHVTPNKDDVNKEDEDNLAKHEANLCIGQLILILPLPLLLTSAGEPLRSLLPLLLHLAHRWRG